MVLNWSLFWAKVLISEKSVNEKLLCVIIPGAYDLISNLYILQGWVRRVKVSYSTCIEDKDKDKKDTESLIIMKLNLGGQSFLH